MKHFVRVILRNSEFLVLEKLCNPEWQLFRNNNIHLMYGPEGNS